MVDNAQERSMRRFLSGYSDERLVSLCGVDLIYVYGRYQTSKSTQSSVRTSSAYLAVYLAAYIAAYIAAYRFPSTVYHVPSC